MSNHSIKSGLVNKVTREEISASLVEDVFHSYSIERQDETDTGVFPFPKEGEMPVSLGNIATGSSVGGSLRRKSCFGFSSILPGPMRRKATQH
ncbi:hypothetical protein [Reticulibacter mediterranei]|uniref:hypothetical protein n=1 Tax=Reticulibacter mediterranei TaxID=2778369 RepID=UPI001C68E38A|nr:hypothetical protein [Reticulibacter mediterranei]